MYYILDLEQNPPKIIETLEFETEQEACEWIDQNGDAVIYSIVTK
jgi:hypothetical protein